jgi:acyl-CoA synthetase (AMP-forming)/AMP-acid ligase II
MLSHYQIIKNAYDQGERMEISEKDRLVVPVPFSHCFGCVMSITMLGSVGGAIAPLIAFDERDALETVQRYKCTMIHGTPTMFLRELKLFRSEKFDTSSLRTGIMAGAHCPEDLMRAVTEEMGPNLCITYGLTEASPGITMTSLNDSIKDKVNTVGKPLPDIEAKIVDDNGREVLPGTVGEIICKGYNVMKGYYKAPELTAEVIKDGWLYSGDLGFMDERGYITFKGRKKELVITGGFNVYPPDVERFIREFDKVLDVAIIGAPDEDLGEVVAAAVIPAEGVKLDPQEIVDFCYGKIASPKVPRYVYITDHFPLSGRGKVQKYKLVEEVKQLINEGKLKKIIPTAVKMRKEKAKNLLGNGSWKE